MAQIEVYIKVTPNNQIYSLPIRKSETILKLKEYCKVLSKIPQDQQNLLYKGNILLNEKFIGDYDIKDNDNIILVKKEEPKQVNIPIKQNFNNLNSNEHIFNNINISNNDEINVNEMANAYKGAKIQDILSFFDNADLDKLDNYYKLMGIKFSDIFGMELQMFKEGLKVPSIRNHFKNMMNMSKDPSYLEICLKDPKIQDVIKNNPLIKLNMQNPQLILNPQILQMNQNIFKKNESNQDENSNSEIFKPPEPFGNLNNNQFNQKTNSSHQILNNLNLCEDILNFFSNNKIDTNTCKQFQSQDFLSFFDNIDLDKLSTFYKSLGLKFSDIFGVETPEFKELLKDPSFRSCMKNMKNMLKDPSFREMLLKDPNKQAIFKKYPIMELAFHNPELALNPQYIYLKKMRVIQMKIQYLKI